MPSLIDKIFKIGSGSATRIGLIFGLLSAIGLFGTEFLKQECKDVLCVLLFVTKSSAAVTLFGAIRKWREVADVKEREAKAALGELPE